MTQAYFHSLLDGANLGMTLASTVIALVVLSFSTGAAFHEARRWRTTTPSIVCVMSVLISIGMLVFSTRRIALMSTGSPLVQTQPTWSVISVIVGCSCTAGALIAGMVWRASRLRPGTGRKVAVINAAFVAVCLCGGALAHA